MTFGRSLRSRFWRGSVEAEVDNEFAFHVEMRVRELVERGMSPADARREAIRRFGDIHKVNAICRDLGRRRDKEMRRIEYVSELTQDVTFALRQLAHNPGFTIVAIVTLALGIGATAAIFSVVQSVILRPLPVPQPDRIVAIYEDSRGNRSNVSAGNYVDGIEPVGGFMATTAIQYSSFNLAEATDAERVIGARTTAGFFPVFGVAPLHGRVYTAAEDQPGRELVAVLSHRLWSRRFGSDPAVVGREVRLNGRPYQVVGVMPPSFDFTAQTEELWVPVAFTAERKAMHDEHYLTVYGRLRGGATEDQVRAELQRNAMTLRERFPRDNPELGFTTRGVMDELVGDYRRRLFILLGAVAFVLLIGCANIANLLLARGASRAGELAIRAALGAGRARMVRQLLTESAVLALVSSAAGLALATWGIRALVAAAPPGVPRLEQTSIDPVVLAFTFLVAIGSAAAFGVAPALRAARTDVQTVIKEGGRGAGMGGVRDRLRTTLIAGELALTLLLLVGAGLLIRSSLALQRVDTGFDPRGVLATRLSLPSAEYEKPEHVVATYDRVMEAVRNVPGVRAAALTSQVPMGGGGNGNGLIPEGKPFDIRNAVQSRLRIVTPGYFEAMRIPILKGRPLNDGDRRGALKVMVISATLANALFPGQDPIGRRVACCEPGPDGKSPDYKTVVGVAGDVRWRGPSQAPTPEFYLPIPQVPAAAWDWIQRTLYVVARTDMEPMSLTNPLRGAVAAVAPGVPLFDVRTMEQRIGASLASAKFNTLLLSLLGAIGLVLASVGIYGVIAYFVSRRTQEIGVRMALGATRLDVVALVVGQAAWPLGLGIAAGVAMAAALTRVLDGQLFEVRPQDPVTFGIVAGVLGAVGLAASLFPARRAASVDPTRALHTN
jgi:predicted permease